VTRRPYSFGKGSGRGHLPGPLTWKYYDGLAGYSATQLWPVLRELEELGVASDSLATSSGLRRALCGAHGPEVRSSLQRAQSALSIRPPVDESRLLESMEAAEAAGRVGRVAFGSELTALDCAMGDLKVEGFKASGLAVAPPIRFDMDVDFEWQPVDSQRLLLWAGQWGKQELVARALFRFHFEEQRSLTSRSTLVAAARSAGIGEAAGAAFLDGPLLRAEVLDGYDRHMRCGIRWPPFLVLNGPGGSGGPFRDGSKDCLVVRGSAEAFADAFERIWAETFAFESVPSCLGEDDPNVSRDSWRWSRWYWQQDGESSRWSGSSKKGAWSAGWSRSRCWDSWSERRKQW